MINNSSRHLSELNDHGFTITDPVYSEQEIEQLIALIESADTANETFRKSTDIFAIRQLLKEIPETISLIFNERFRETLRTIAGTDYFPVKSIYFDKPETSNWYVACHQDLTISTDQKTELPGFGSWTKKHHQFAVQPPTEFLENIVTFRIHLDNTDEHNGALNVIPGSHAKGIYRPETIDWQEEKGVFCPVKKGGIMVMKPLLLHRSFRTTDNRRRRVIHIEFSNKELPAGLHWAERIAIDPFL